MLTFNLLDEVCVQARMFFVVLETPDSVTLALLAAESQHGTVSLQAGVQDLQVLLQHAAAGQAGSGPRALHRPDVFRRVVLLRRQFPAGRGGAGEARAPRRFLRLI